MRCGTTSSGVPSAHLLLGLAEGERLRLREDIGDQEVVMVAQFRLLAKPIRSAGISFVPWWISW